MATEKSVKELVINKVENQKVYDYMVSKGLINDDEIYLIQDTSSDLDYKITQVNLTSTTTNGSISYNCDKTFTEIISLINDKTIVICKYIENNSTIPILTYLNSYNSSSILKFIGTNSDGKQITISINNSNVISVTIGSNSTSINLIDH